MNEWIRLISEDTVHRYSYLIILPSLKTPFYQFIFSYLRCPVSHTKLSKQRTSVDSSKEAGEGTYSACQMFGLFSQITI